MKTETKRKVLTIISGIALAMVLFAGASSVSLAYTQTTGIVSATAAKVRKEPSTESDVVVGLLKGSTVTVTDEVTDSAGMVWYKVSVENSTGYIRSDLLLKANTTTTSTTTTNSGTSDSSTTNDNATTSKPAATSVKTIAETKAYVNYESARVREGASTEHEIVGSVTKNTPVTITGEAKSSSGKLWYQVKYTNSSGREVVGFIRSDLLTIGEPPAAVATTEESDSEQTESEDAVESEESAEGEETLEGEGSAQSLEAETAAEEPVQEVTEKPDYEMVYTQNNEGVEEWYLYDNINGTRQTLAGLMSAAEAATRMSENENKQIATQKIVIIILAVVVAILAVVVTLLLFKLKDLYDDGYEDYDGDEDEDEDEEDEDEEDEEEEPVVRKKRVAAAPKQVKVIEPVKEVKTVKTKSAQPVKKVEYDPQEEAFEAGQSVTEKPQPKRKAKNFLIDDDEFEFEFLNMDDKK